LDDDLKSSTRILNEIQEPNNYTALLLWENYNSLIQSVPNNIKITLNKIDYNSIQGLKYKTILGNYYLNNDKTEIAEKIFNTILNTIQETDENRSNSFELIHFYSNYAYFLNSQSKFKKSVENAEKAINLIKTSGYNENKQVNSTLKSCYFTYSMALLGSKKYSLLERTLYNWQKLELTQSNDNVLYIIARLQEETGKAKKAINSFKEYLKFNNDPYANFHLGKCYLEIKDNNSACIEFETSCDNGVELACRFLKIKCND
jgi:tetratricopeptide (TPR) repeat protein